VGREKRRILGILRNKLENMPPFAEESRMIMMKIQKKLWVSLVLVLFILEGLAPRVYADIRPTAQTVTSGRQPETGSEAPLLPVADPEGAAPPEVSEPAHDPTTYTQDDFFTQKTLKGIYSSADLYFFVPTYWDVKYVYAQIQYDVSQLLEGKASSITLSVNGVPIQSYRLEYNNGSPQILYVKIPISEIRTGFNSLTISAYARLFDEEGCVDDASDANWLRIYDTSHIRSGYEAKDPEHRISYYPYPFMSTYNPTGKGLTIAVSDQASNGEVAAAMNLMADLSSDTKVKNEIEVSLLSDVANKNTTRTILVSTYDNLPQEYKNLVGKAPDSTGNATVTYTDDSQGRPLLIITSMEEDSLIEASNMLMDENRVKQENGQTAVIEKGSGQIAVNAGKQSDMMAGNYTLEDIMGSGLMFVGPFHQDNYVYLPVTGDYVLSEGGKIALKFRYSENLDFTRSLVTVSWGEIPIASKRLSKENASGDELNFEIPGDILGTAASSIKVSFDLEIADLICTPRQSDMPWAYVSKESTLFLPPSNGINLYFDVKGSPFRNQGKFNQVMLVIPDKPSGDELNLLGQVVAMYGNGIKPYGSLIVRKGSEFQKDDGDYNIITVGTFLDNSLIAQINDSLSFHYTPDGTGFESNEQLILSRDYAGQIGILQLIKSPFALNRGLLAVTGCSSESISHVQEYLRQSKKRDELKKDCVIIAPDSSITAFQFIQGTAANAEPAPMEKLVQNKRSVIFTIVATSAMSMMLVAVIIILLRIRMYRKRDE
jgi:hypothetical protein